jgi:hypothetical protein
MISHDVVREQASAEVFARYVRQIVPHRWLTGTSFDRLSLASALADLPDFRYCLAPGCDSGQIHDDEDDESNIFRCNECGYRYCTSHNIAFHVGETCDEYDERMRDEARTIEDREALSAALIEDISKLCPGPGCSYRIEKHAGCDHITCELSPALLKSFLNADCVFRHTMRLPVLLDMLYSLSWSGRYPKGWQRRAYRLLCTLSISTSTNQSRALRHHGCLKCLSLR